MNKAIENLAHAVSCCEELLWKKGEQEPYLLEAAREAVKAFRPIPISYGARADEALKENEKLIARVKRLVNAARRHIKSNETMDLTVEQIEEDQASFNELIDAVGEFEKEVPSAPQP
jgi:hypothetical protein